MAHGGVRPRRAAADARLRDERPRPRHEHLDVRIRSRIPTSRSIAARCSTAESWSDSASWGRYKDVDGDGIPYRTLPGTGAGLLHARLRPQRDGAVQRAAGRLRQQHRPAGAQVRHGADARARAGRRAGAGAKVGIIAYGSTTGRSRRAATSCARKPARDRLPPPARVSVHRRTSTSSSRARSRLRRRAEPRRPDAAACCGWTAGRTIGELRSVLHYNGLPIDARSDHRRILAQEARQQRSTAPRATSIARRP